MQRQSKYADTSRFVPRLFKIRREVDAALKALRECCHVERSLRLAKRLANVGDADRAFLTAARGVTLSKRWHAKDAIIRAGLDLLLVCVAIDQSDMAVAQKMDLLGCRHRSWVLPRAIEFGRMIGDGWEVAPLDFDGNQDPRVGPLLAAGLAVLNRNLLDQHEALRPAVEAFDAQVAEQKRMEAAAERGSVIIDGPATIQ
ncbi:hypothetical protein [Paraburkholderia tropica]|uniref:hypothetical protein n=1 Tax=Paraburkholderia tropica TaxID=92647 RepID=UPI002AAF69FE|nr:hypothetical protein [Paraburkholderia tropica]